MLFCIPYWWNKCHNSDSTEISHGYKAWIWLYFDNTCLNCKNKIFFKMAQSRVEMNYGHKERSLDQLSTLQPITSHCASVSLCPFISFFPFIWAEDLCDLWHMPFPSYKQSQHGWLSEAGGSMNVCLLPMWYSFPLRCGTLDAACSAHAEKHPRDHIHSSRAISSKMTKCMMNQMNNKYRAQNDVVEFLIFTTADKML